MKMKFLDFLKRYLNVTGSIYTVRKYRMRDGLVEVEDVGSCCRELLGLIRTKEELESYYQQSGFESLDAWWKRIKMFIPTDGPYYLYRVTK